MFFSALCLLGVAVVSQSAMLPNYEFDPQIINGKDAAPGEIPYQVSLQDGDFHFCGGSIINRYYVLTAAHCVEDQTAKNIVVIAGTVNLKGPHTKHTVVKIISHKDYNRTNLWINDIALCKVATPFVPSRDVAFATLPEQDEFVKPGSAALVSGFGRTAINNPGSITLKRATIYIRSQKYCRKIYKPDGYIHDSQICANDLSMIKGSCLGDSGGPLTVNGKLVGIVSWSKFCALRTFPTVYTRVSSFINWIKMHAV